MKRLTAMSCVTVRRVGNRIVATARISNGRSTRTITKSTRVGR